MAMLWDGGAAGCCGLYRHLSLVGMSTSVLGDKLRAFATAPRRLSREYGPDGTTAGRRHRSRRIVPVTDCESGKVNSLGRLGRLSDVKLGFSRLQYSQGPLHGENG